MVDNAIKFHLEVKGRHRTDGGAFHVGCPALLMGRAVDVGGRSRVLVFVFKQRSK